MFSALALVLFIGEPVPREMHDVRGPYVTREQCESRLGELRDLVRAQPGTIYVAGLCRRGTEQAV